MKLITWFRAQNLQTKLMIGVIVLLLIMIATRWAYITHTAGVAFRDRFVPPTERVDTTVLSTPTTPADTTIQPSPSR